MRIQGAMQIGKKTRNAQSGMSLVETMVALSLLLIIAAGLMSMAGVAMTTTENQGHLAARTAEYAQDKMEQLLALRYDDPNTDTTVFPSVVNPGVGTGLTVGGSINPNAPVVGYSDYVDATGSPVAAGANWQYVRTWRVTEDATLTLKTITVVTQVRYAVGGPALRPQATVVCLKSKPF